MFDAIFFDLDGTLIDSETLWMEAVGRTLAETGQRLTAEELVELVYGRAWGDIFADIIRRYPGAVMNYEEMSAATRGHFFALRQTRDIRIPSSIEVFRHLAATYPLAVVSGSTREDVGRALDELELQPLIRFFLSCEDYSPGKPHPACYLLAAERLGVSPARCLVFEDSAHGVRAAKAAGMTCIALLRPGHPSQGLEEADQVVGDLRECLPI